MALVNNINQFNERIQIITLEDTQNENGEIVQEEVVVYECWASPKTRFLKDYKSEAGTVLEDTTQFVIRAMQSYEIKNEDRLKWNGNKYKIVRVNKDISQKEYDVLICKKYG